LWLGCGSDDSLFAANESLSKMLDEALIKHVFRKSDGGEHLDQLAALLE
jgi:hypothetical protein